MRLVTDATQELPLAPTAAARGGRRSEHAEAKPCDDQAFAELLVQRLGTDGTRVEDDAAAEPRTSQPDVASTDAGAVLNPVELLVGSLPRRDDPSLGDPLPEVPGFETPAGAEGNAIDQASPWPGGALAWQDTVRRALAREGAARAAARGSGGTDTAEALGPGLPPGEGSLGISQKSERLTHDEPSRETGPGEAATVFPPLAAASPANGGLPASPGQGLGNSHAVTPEQAADALPAAVEAPAPTTLAVEAERSTVAQGPREVDQGLRGTASAQEAAGSTRAGAPLESDRPGPGASLTSPAAGTTSSASASSASQAAASSTQTLVATLPSPSSVNTAHALAEVPASQPQPPWENAFQGRISAAPTAPSFAPALGLQLRTVITEGFMQARLALQPEHWGPIDVRIDLDGTQARVWMSAEHPVTCRALEAALPQLSSSLGEAGLTLSGGSVSSSQDEARRQAQSSARDQRSASGDGRSKEGQEPQEAQSAVDALQRRRPRGAVDVYA